MKTSTDHAQPSSDNHEPRRATTLVAHPLSNKRGAPLTKAVRVRGGVSVSSAVSGILVAFASMVVLGALIGAVLTATGVAEGNLSTEEMRRAGIWGILALLLVQFIAYLWGGYTAGRMARGSGLMNGALVALGAALVLSIVGGVVVANAGLPSMDTFDALAIPVDDAGQAVTASGIALLATMVAGACLGGRLGARWHTRLEDAHLPAALR